MKDPVDERFFDTLDRARQEFKLPSHLRARTEFFARDVLAFLFPHFAAPGEGPTSWPERQAHLERVLLEVVAPLADDRTTCSNAQHRFIEELPGIRETLLLDAEAIRRNDPAAKNLDIVILSYPGFFAIAVHRIAHCFCECNIPYFPRLLSEFAHRETGIDIHPSAVIGKEFSIDHGTGIVIGETTRIGERVRLFQGVTLGALSVQKSLANVKRHPTLEDDVVVYANATILGGETVVGRGSTIGGNVWLTRSVPPESVVTEAKPLERARTASDALLDYYL